MDSRVCLTPMIHSRHLLGAIESATKLNISLRNFCAEKLACKQQFSVIFLLLRPPSSLRMGCLLDEDKCVVSTNMR